MFVRIIKLSLLALAAVLIAGAGAYFTLTTLIRSEDTVIVPDLVGKDVVWVLELLTDLGLNTKVSGSEYSPDLPKNRILHQRPSPGTEIKRGRDVKIILSKGTKALMAPELAGLSLQQARLVVEEHDLVLSALATTHSRQIRKGDVISQAPTAGSRITRGSQVDLLVSDGPRPVSAMMPLLSGIPLEEAILLLEKQALTLGEIRSQYVAGMAEDTVMVIDQEPLFGARVIAGTLVNLTINRTQNRQASKPDSNQAALYRYRLKRGFLKHHVRVRVNRSGYSFDYLNELMDPGRELLLLVPEDGRSTVFLYIDGELVETKVYG